MPESTVRTPNGQTVTVRHPEGATDEEILAFAQANYQATPVQPTEPPAQPPIQTGRFEAKDAPLGDKIKLAAGYFLNSDTDARKDMLQNILGEDITFEQDEDGNEIAVYQNERAYINPPGMDMGNAIDFIGDVVKFAPAAKVAGWVGGAGKFLGTARAALGGGAAAGATQAASDVASEQFGSEQGISPVGVAAATTGGAVGELMAPFFRYFTPAAKKAMNRAKELGINLKGTPGEQVSQLATAAGKMASPEEGAGVSQVASALRAAKKAENRTASAAMERARAGNAAVPLNTVKEFADRAAARMESFDLGAEGMNAIQRRMNDLSELKNMEGPLNVKLNAMEKWRRRVSSMSPKDGSPAQEAARQLKDEYDNWLRDAFDNAMIKGDPKDVLAWKEGRDAWAHYKQTFSADKTVKNLASKKTSPEQMSAWLFNSSAVGAKKEASEVVKKIGNIIGIESPQMNALRSDVMLDLAEPLLGDSPNVKGFLANYDKFFKKNPSLKRELFPGKYGKDLDEFVEYTKAIAKRPGADATSRPPVDMMGRLLGFVNRMAVGHGLAKGQARLQTTGGLATWLRHNLSGPIARKNILREILGQEPKAPLIPVPAAGVGAGAALQLREN